VTNHNIDLTLGIHEGTFIYSDNLSDCNYYVQTQHKHFLWVQKLILIQAGAGVVTITPAGGVNLNGANIPIPITAQWGGVTLKQITIDNWIIVGKI
jgi:hypothetical protein